MFVTNGAALSATPAAQQQLSEAAFDNHRSGKLSNLGSHFHFSTLLGTWKSKTEGLPIVFFLTK